MNLGSTEMSEDRLAQLRDQIEARAYDVPAEAVGGAILERLRRTPVRDLTPEELELAGAEWTARNWEARRNLDREAAWRERRACSSVISPALSEPDTSSAVEENSPPLQFWEKTVAVGCAAFWGALIGAFVAAMQR